jgi:hypothetical protein
MKMSIRLKYMGYVFVDMIAAIGKLTAKVGLPVAACIGLLALLNYTPLWFSITTILGTVAIVYVWIMAGKKFQKDREISEDLLDDKYYEITRTWSAMSLDGKSYRTIYGLMTSILDDYDALLEQHKEFYGEDVTYKHYRNSIDQFIKRCEDAEKVEQQRQEQRAAELREEKAE